jgi:membrane fusion protein (multidrug efflux system)
MSAPQTAESRAPEPRSRRQRTRMILLVVVPLIAAAIALAFYLEGGRYISTDNAYVKADKVPLSAEVSGAIKDVLVHENQTVSAGQVLFRLDPAPFQVAVAKAEAKLAQVRTDLSALQASYREKQAEIALARTRLAFANRDQQRQADLVAKHFISASRYDDAKQNTELAAQQITALQQDLKRIAETLGGSINSDITRHPSYLAAEAELEQAKLDLAHVEVHASLPGTVGTLPKPGQYVTAGSVVTALVANGHVWVEANFPETDLTHVHPGQPVSIRVDTYPSLTWHGVVDSLSPATGSEFSVIPAQNATGNWVKITQRVPVRIRLAPRSDAPQLRAGLSTEVEIDTGHRRRLLGLSL